jgi:hypothetical protein
VAQHTQTSGRADFAVQGTVCRARIGDELFEGTPPENPLPDHASANHGGVIRAEDIAMPLHRRDLRFEILVIGLEIGPGRARLISSNCETRAYG